MLSVEHPAMYGFGHEETTMPQPIRLAVLASVAIGGALLTAPAHAVLYDLATDWSTVNNGTGGNPWSYRGGTSALPVQSDLTLLTFPFTQPGWAPSNTIGSFLPIWFKASGNPSLGGIDILADDVVTHTWDAPNGGSSGQSNILFTAPIGGTATISGSAFNSRNLNRAERWDIFVNNVQQVGDTLPGDGSNIRASADTFNLANVVLDAGDTVELRITTLGSAGDFVTVSMSVEMTPAPEPTSLALLGTGLAAVFLRRRSA